MTEQKERLKKLYALALRGVGGEKAQLKRRVQELEQENAILRTLIHK